ncbi:testis-specific Y-encoded-like protein 2 [Conger conger]|uniref:testis-specific Y-encoded-like protein 2 n=1 Tax=Conger conger TaxID=82655 RepID=UPI002A5A7198|nr:testis-specific Y-encoded-like protein 2 [Conger conger]
MSEPTDCKQQSKPSKRSASPEQSCSSPPAKAAKVQDDIQELALDSRGGRNGEAAPVEPGGERVHGEADVATKTEDPERKSIETSFTSNSTESANERPTTSSGIAKPAACGNSGESERPVEAAVAGAPGRRSVLLKGPGHASSHQQSDWAAIAAAEALASLTGGDGDGERPHSSKDETDKQGPGKRHTPRPGDCTDSHQRGNCPKTRAVAADSSTSVPERSAVLGTAAIERIDRSRDTDDDDDDDEEEDDEDSLLASSSSPDFSSGSEDCTAEDAECAIVSVKLAPETRQAVAQLARLQMQLETLERKGVRQHQRLELKLNQQRRPHLDQRGSIIKDIPGFWVAALLNHPQLSAHIDENDEDALSYMTNLEIENNGMGYRIGFHFRRNPYFQNSVIVKELHLALGGSAMSFSNPILWHRGQNLTARTRLVKGPGAFPLYPSFFTWFSDHSNPERDEIAQIMKNDLYKNPLRYYLTPMWEPRLNGSAARVTINSNSSDCVVISDSDDDDEDDDDDDDKEEEGDPAVNQSEEDRDTGKSSEEDDEEVRIEGSEEDEDGEAIEEDGIIQEREEEEELDVEELEDAEGCGGPETTEQEEQEEEDVEVDEEEEEEES